MFKRNSKDKTHKINKNLTTYYSAANLRQQNVQRFII